MTGFFAKILVTIYDFIGNYGISIIVFTILVRLALLPLAINQRKSMVATQKLQPKLKELQKKYKNDKETLSKKQLELYKEHNYNPLSGCLPLLIQFPIIISLFNVFRNAAEYMPAKAIHEKFLWLPNMENPDVLSNIIPMTGIVERLPGILPIIAAVFTYLTFQTSVAPQPNTDAPKMGFMAYLAPAMILWFGSNYAAGLILYWAVSNIIQYVQNLVLQKMYDGGTGE